MPTFIHGKSTGVFIDAYDLSAYFNSADYASSIDTAETTSFGSSAKSYITGLNDATLSLSGMYSQDAGGSDVVLNTLLGQATSPAVTVVFKTGTIGNRCIVGQAHETSYSISNPVADVSTVSADFNATAGAVADQVYGLHGGVVLTTGASILYSALGNLSSVDNAASSAAGSLATLHVTTNTISGGNTAIIVQHSPDNTTFADLITFTVVPASTTVGVSKASTGTVNRYVRVNASTLGSSGSITFNVGFARN
jgi:hypothetical protein